MNTQPFAVGSKQPLMKGCVLTYAVSGQKLEDTETVQAVVRLPYCLYVPSTRYVFNSPVDGEVVGVVPQKVWTKRSEGSTIEESEFVVLNEPVYLDGSQVITEWIGQPKPLTEDLQARNMEFERDPNGYFRYTRLTLEFDWQVPGGYDPSKEGNDGSAREGEHPVVAEISAMALAFVNHFVDVVPDCYRRRIHRADTCVVY